MGITEEVIEKLRALPEEKQRLVLEYVDTLGERNEGRRPRRSLKGLLSDVRVSITEEDIAEARREMWGNFPRDFPE